MYKDRRFYSFTVLFTVSSLGACGVAHDVERENEGFRSYQQAPGDADAGDEPSFDHLGKPVAITKNLVFPEGPVWSPSDAALYFTDITGNQIYRLTLPDTIEVVLSPAQHADGLALDVNGDLIVAGYSARTLWRVTNDQLVPMVDHTGDKRLNSPDDVTVRSDGTIYFTDPTFGLSSGKGGGSDTGVQGVYRVSVGGDLQIEDSTRSGPNGVSLSPDERSLYVSYTNTGDIAAFDVAPDGSLSNKHTIVKGATGADSMTVDSDGNLYVATLAGISIYTPKGASLATIKVPEWTSNVSFGGPDQRTLFITARAASSGALYRVDDMPVAGIPGRP